ncbi:MAG: hypothetical protein QGG55_09520, partial [Verrucomicrobiota bacterium]|nr:hypothetical protein [Verrucomicrobiota bacterium]
MSAMASHSLAADLAALKAINSAGGLALPHPGKGEQWEVEFHLRGRELTDEGLKHVAALKNVVV